MNLAWPSRSRCAAAVVAGFWSTMRSVMHWAEHTFAQPMRQNFGEADTNQL